MHSQIFENIFQFRESIFKNFIINSTHSVIHEYSTQENGVGIIYRKRGEKIPQPFTLPYARHDLVSAYHAARLLLRIDSSPLFAEEREQIHLSRVPGTGEQPARDAKILRTWLAILYSSQE